VTVPQASDSLGGTALGVAGAVDTTAARADRLAGVLPAARNRPPDHVLGAFGVPTTALIRMPGGRGRAWRAGDTVIRPVDNSAEASWLASVLEQCTVPEVRIARPVRS
jgi:hypothetical protein